MTLAVVFHNLRVNRPAQLVGRETRQLAADTDPDVLAVCEAWQYGAQLANVPGYAYLCRRGATPSERDAGLLVRRGLSVGRFGVVRTRTSWPRTKGPGRHWPRSFPWADVEGVRVVVVHFPRNLPANRLAVAECWTRLLLLALRTPRPLLLVGDTNQSRRARGLWSPNALARTIGGRLFGVGIMHALARGLTVSGVRLLPDSRGSDHKPLAVTVKRRRRRGRASGGG